MIVCNKRDAVSATVGATRKGGPYRDQWSESGVELASRSTLPFLGYPTSRKIDRSVNPPTIAQDTYAAPASEAPFAVTGFAAVARFALPNLMPACFRYELQPVAGTLIECGASVPLYGQSGGGVEVKFTNLTNNRCAIADPIILPAL